MPENHQRRRSQNLEQLFSELHGPSSWNPGRSETPASLLHVPSLSVNSAVKSKEILYQVQQTSVDALQSLTPAAAVAFVVPLNTSTGPRICEGRDANNGILSLHNPGYYLVEW